MANKITFGLSNVHIAFFNEEDTTPTWEAPKPIKGAVRFAPTAEGESSTFYADNMAYYTATSNNGYSAELEMAAIPDDILADMLGWEIDSNGMLVEVADGIQKPFALMFQVEGDVRSRRNVYFNCKASRPSKEHNTKGETIEPNTDVLNLSIQPIEIEDKKLVKGSMQLNETNATAYNAFFTAVTLPELGA